MKGSDTTTPRDEAARCNNSAGLRAEYLGLRAGRVVLKNYKYYIKMYQYLVFPILSSDFM
jgi:hypothetical protein